MNEWWVTIPLTLIGACATCHATGTAPDLLPTTAEVRELEGCAAVCAKQAACELDTTGCVTMCEHSTPDPIACGECAKRESCTSILAGSCYKPCYEVQQ